MVTLAHHAALTAGDLERFMGLTVGFDTMFDRLFNVPQPSGSYPPYNIRKVDNYNYVIEVALAGFSENDIEVQVEDGTLTVRSKEDKDVNETSYVHRGIAKRMFVRKWTLSDDMIVQGAEFQNGLLNIKLEKVVPEEKKPRMIPISTSNVIEHTK
jgi:molecular chaperone IbpA|tara:strand:+ start:3355 stop:3819 length:465 start_codon:yes stop_codon:yes gene_type:complete